MSVHFANTPVFLKELTTAATPVSGVLAFYAKTDNKLYYKDDLGVETAIAAGVGLVNMTETLHTASPNNTVNAEQLEVTGGTTNADLVLTPKGTGAFIVGNEPDGTLIGGNKRGANAVDLQTSTDRGNIAEVASGQYSAVLGGNRNRATGTCATVAGGGRSGSGKAGNIASGVCSFVGGGASNTAGGTEATVGGGIGNTANGEESSILGGQNNTASAQYSWVAGGFSGVADRWGMGAWSSGNFAVVGDSQSVVFVMRCKTTTNTAVQLDLRGNGTQLLGIPSGKIFSGIVNIVGTKSDGTAVARYLRQVSIKNVAGTTSLVGSVITLGNDEAVGTSISITANDTNDALRVEATGIASETWRWVATVQGAEVAYGT